MASCNDNDFGPAVAKGCRGSFDFTLIFQQSILSMGPSVIFLLFVPARILKITIRRRIFVSAPASKQLLRTTPLIVYLALQVSLLCLWTSPAANQLRTRLSTADASLRIADAVALGLLSLSEFRRTLRPSTLSIVYLAFTAALDAVYVRTLWLMSDPGARILASISTGSLAMKILVLLIECQGKKKWLLGKYKALGPEETSGILSRVAFWWLNPLLWRGFRAVLSPENLFPTDASLDTNALSRRFQRSWTAESRTRHQSKLFFATSKALKGPILAAVLPRLCQSAFGFSQPFLLSAVVNYIQETDADQNFGYGLIGATAIIYVGLAFSVAIYKHRTYRLITMIRGGLISLVYTKTLELEAGSLKDGSGMTMIGTDCESIAQGLINVHEIWAAPIDIGLALYLLKREVGVACVAPVIIAVASTVISIQIAKLTRRRQKKWIEAVQKRVAMTASLLSSIKGAKMTGLAQRIAGGIQLLRQNEIDRAKAYLRIDAISNVIASTPTLLSPVATLLIFVFTQGGMSSGALTSARTFSALSIVALMNQPLALALNALPTFWASLACFERIQEYLLRDERKDFRLQQASSSAISLSESPSPKSAFRDENDAFNREPGSIIMKSLSKAYGNQHVSPLVKIHEASFGWNDAKCVLQGVELEFLAGRRYIVSGPVGSGKSTLLRAVLGETCCLEGSVSVMTASIAFCGQDPWVSNTSIKENILAGEPFDIKLYRRVITACGLEKDLSELVDGDQTLLGSKGTRLSGGQIKRIALARAAYSRRPLVLLDDCFSSLDPKTENEVFTQLLGPVGLFTSLGCCVVLATQRLSQPFKGAQRIFISQTGEVKSLNASSLSLEPTEARYPDKITSERETEHDIEGSQGASNNAPPSGPSTTSELKADIARQMGDSAVYRFYIAKIGLIHGLVYLFLNGLTAFFPRFSQAWVSFWVEATANDPSHHTNAVYGSAYALLSLGGLVTFYLVMIYMFQIMVPRSARKLHEEQLNTVIRAPYSFLSRTDSGVILNRFSQDMTLIDLELPSYAVQAFFYIFNCVGQVIIVATGIKYMAALIPAILVIVYALQKFYLRTSRQIRFLDLEAKSPLYSHMMETCEGLLTVRAFGWQQRFIELNTTLINMSQRPLYSLYCIQRWLNLVLALVVAGIVTVLVTLGTQLRQETNGNSMGVALVNVVNFAQSLASLITAWTSLETALGAVARIKSFTTDVKAEDDCVRSSNTRDSDYHHLAEVAFHGKIEYNAASFSYEEHGDQVLRDLSLLVEPGTRLGICGRSGSGKSSLVLSLLRMLHPCGGSVRIGGHDTRDLSSEALRSAFIVLPQTPVLLPGSVRTNLDPYSSLSADNDELIISVLTQMGIWDAIHGQGGLEADVDNLTLSHGQAQLFAVARAVLDKYIHKTHKIVLLDEVTNGLDSEAASLVMGFLHRAFHGHTIIAIAHQLDTILDYERVLVLSSGQVVEDGVPRELLGHPGGWFRALWEGGVPQAGNSSVGSRENGL